MSRTARRQQLRYREVLWEGSFSQKLGWTNRNRIPGLCRWVSEQYIAMPNTHPEATEVNSVRANWKCKILPREVCKAVRLI
ncbi:MAG: hypothetical protein JEZ07_19450 [Phycisphaerae bacterium]|nr:hypothetical protein [Phycisphaerae bacterium]